MPLATLIEKLVGKRKAAEAEKLQDYGELVAQLAKGGPEPKIEVVDQILEMAGRTPEQLSADVADEKLADEKRAVLAKKSAAEADLAAAQSDLESAATERATVIEAANRKHSAIVTACKLRIQEAGVTLRQASDAHVWLLEHSKNRQEVNRLYSQISALSEPLRGDKHEEGLLDDQRKLQQRLESVNRRLKTATPREEAELTAEMQQLTDKLNQVNGEIASAESQINRLQDRVRTLEQQALSA